MKKVIVIIFLFDFIQRIVSKPCHKYSYDPSIYIKNNKTFCVHNNVIHPCSDDTICPFTFSDSNISCISKDNVSFLI